MQEGAHEEMLCTCSTFRTAALSPKLPVSAVVAVTAVVAWRARSTSMTTRAPGGRGSCRQKMVTHFSLCVTPLHTKPAYTGPWSTQQCWKFLDLRLSAPVRQQIHKFGSRDTRRLHVQPHLWLSIHDSSTFASVTICSP